MVKISIYTTILTYSACKGTTFFFIPQTFAPKKNAKYVVKHKIRPLRC